MLSLSFRDQSAGWSWESVPSLQVFFSFRRVLFFCRERPPAAHFSHQLEKWAKAHTVVSAGFQPRCGVKIGTLPRNHLASSATGGASAISCAAAADGAKCRSWYFFRLGRRPRRPAIGVNAPTFCMFSGSGANAETILPLGHVLPKILLLGTFPAREKYPAGGSTSRFHPPILPQTQQNRGQTAPVLP